MKFSNLFIVLNSIIPAARSAWAYECKTGSDDLNNMSSFVEPWTVTGTTETINFSDRFGHGGTNFNTLHSDLTDHFRCRFHGYVKAI